MKKINKRKLKRLKARRDIIIRSLEINQTCLYLTGGLIEDHMMEQASREREELENILKKLGEGPVHIGLSHNVIETTEEDLVKNLRRSL